jgi:hypothetical protein
MDGRSFLECYGVEDGLSLSFVVFVEGEKCKMFKGS